MKPVNIEYTIRDQVNVSDNMNWIATDEEGRMFAYEHEPIPVDCDKKEKGVWVAPGDFEYIKHVGYTKNWKDTLIKI